MWYWKFLFLKDTTHIFSWIVIFIAFSHKNTPSTDSQMSCVCVCMRVWERVHHAWQRSWKCVCVCVPALHREQSWENPSSIPAIPPSTTPRRKKQGRNGNKNMRRKARGVTYSVVEIQSPPKISLHRPTAPLSPSLVLLSALSLLVSFPLLCHVALQSQANAPSSSWSCRNAEGWSLVNAVSLSSREETLCTAMVPVCFLCLQLTHTNIMHLHPDIQQYLIVCF